MFVCFLFFISLLLLLCVTFSLRFCSEYTVSGRLRCENKVHICKGLKLNLLIIALCRIVKADVMLPTVSRQLVQLVVQGCHSPHMQQDHSSRCRKRRHFIKHNLLVFSTHYFGNPGCTLCSSGFDGFQQLHYSDISDSDTLFC